MDGGDEGSSFSASPIPVNLSRDASAVVDLTGKVHQLPCCIKLDGPTHVSQYFKPKGTGMEVDGLRVEEAYFRGRKLHGTTISLPQGYSGFILGKKSPDKETNTMNPDSWKAHATFRDIKIWNHDAMPSKDDAFLRAFHWFTAANAVRFLLIFISHEAAGASEEVSFTYYDNKMDSKLVSMSALLLVVCGEIYSLHVYCCHKMTVFSFEPFHVYCQHLENNSFRFLNLQLHLFAELPESCNLQPA